MTSLHIPQVDLSITDLLIQSAPRRHTCDFCCARPAVRALSNGDKTCAGCDEHAEVRK